MEPHGTRYRLQGCSRQGTGRPTAMRAPAAQSALSAGAPEPRRPSRDDDIDRTHATLARGVDRRRPVRRRHRFRPPHALAEWADVRLHHLRHRPVRGVPAGRLVARPPPGPGRDGGSTRRPDRLRAGVCGEHRHQVDLHRAPPVPSTAARLPDREVPAPERLRLSQQPHRSRGRRRRSAVPRQLAPGRARRAGDGRLPGLRRRALPARRRGRSRGRRHRRSRHRRGRAPPRRPPGEPPAPRRPAPPERNGPRTAYASGSPVRDSGPVGAAPVPRGRSAEQSIRTSSSSRSPGAFDATVPADQSPCSPPPRIPVHRPLPTRTPSQGTSAVRGFAPLQVAGGRPSASRSGGT